MTTPNNTHMRASRQYFRNYENKIKNQTTETKTHTHTRCRKAKRCFICAYERLCACACVPAWVHRIYFCQIFSFLPNVFPFHEFTVFGRIYFVLCLFTLFFASAHILFILFLFLLVWSFVLGVSVAQFARYVCVCVCKCVRIFLKERKKSMWKWEYSIATSKKKSRRNQITTTKQQEGNISSTATNTFGVESASCVCMYASMRRTCVSSNSAATTKWFLIMAKCGARWADRQYDKIFKMQCNMLSTIAQRCVLTMTKLYSNC